MYLDEGHDLRDDEDLVTTEEAPVMKMWQDLLKTRKTLTGKMRENMGMAATLKRMLKNIEKSAVVADCVSDDGAAAGAGASGVVVENSASQQELQQSLMKEMRRDEDSHFQYEMEIVSYKDQLEQARVDVGQLLQEIGSVAKVQKDLEELREMYDNEVAQLHEELEEAYRNIKELKASLDAQ